MICRLIEQINLLYAEILPKPIIFYKQSFPVSRRKELMAFVASWAEEDHAKTNHIFMDLRKKECYKCTDDFLTIYFSENKKADTFESQEKIFTISKLIIPSVFAHCFALESNLKEKINFYSKIEALYLKNYREKPSAASKFESLFKAG